jgi:hypothetical protein
MAAEVRPKVAKRMDVDVKKLNNIIVNGWKIEQTEVFVRERVLEQI